MKQVRRRKRKSNEMKESTAIAITLTLLLVFAFFIFVMPHQGVDDNSIECGDPLTTVEVTTPESEYSSIPTSTTTYQPEYFGSIVSITDEERLYLATVVDEKASTESIECQHAIVSTILNRHLLTGESIKDIIYKEGEYGISEDTAYAEPSMGAISAVQYVEHFGTTLPKYVTHFRAGKYHSWGDQEPFVQIGNTYFSYSYQVKEMCE